MEDLEIFNELESHFKSYNETEVKSVSTLTEALSYYKECITKFFSQNGSADSIREMYKAIRNLNDTCEEILIPCVDIGESYHIYQEYLTGMSQFITEINNSNCCMEDSTMPILRSNLEKAKANDEAFVNSLYNGNLTKITDRPIACAASVVEYLIDFIPKIDELLVKSRNLSESITNADECENKKELVDESFTMLCNSVNRFCYHTLSNIFKTYLNIRNSLSGNTDKTVPVVEEYVLL